MKVVARTLWTLSLGATAAVATEMSGRVCAAWLVFSAVLLVAFSGKSGLE